MLNIYENVKDLDFGNENKEELKELLLREFTDYCNDNAIDFVWVGKGVIEVVDETEELRNQFEDEVRDELEYVFEDYIGSLVK